MTVRQLVSAALRKLQVLGAGQTAGAEDAADALFALNVLVNAFPCEPNTMFSVTRTTWTITASDGEYTIGSGGNVNVARPASPNGITVKIIDASYDPDLEMSLGPLLSEDAYAAIPQKALTNTYPSFAYYNPTYPLGTIIFWPTPTSSNLQGVIYAKAAIAEFASLDASVSLPPGYERFLITNLAVEIAPEFGVDVPPDVRIAARESKQLIKRANFRLNDAATDRSAMIATGAGYDIQAGP